MKLAIAALFLAGCATQGQVTPAPSYGSTVLDENCAALAKYTRSISVMRDVGVGVNDVDFILSKSPDLPIGAIKRYVYTRNESDPGVTSKAIYEECVAAGYEPTIARFRVEEISYNVQEKETIQKSLTNAKSLKLDTTVPKIKKKKKAIKK